MRKSWAEYKREWRKEQKRKAAGVGDPTDAIANLPFDRYFRDAANWEIACESLDCVGIEPPTFDADSDDQWSEEWNIPYRGSIGRAERMVGAFLDAATELAQVINVYKLEQVETAINAAVARSANLPRGDVEALKASFAEIDRLKTIRTKLRKPTRHTLPGITANSE